MDIFSFLTQHSIPYQQFEHEAVFTCADAAKLNLPAMPGENTKNLFLRDRSGERHFLVSVGHGKSVDLAALRKQINISKLSFASDERLMKYLGVLPGSVTLLGLVNDHSHAVEVIIDQALWHADGILCHPLVNTATLHLSHAGLVDFLKATGHTPKIIDVPAR